MTSGQPDQAAGLTRGRPDQAAGPARARLDKQPGEVSAMFDSVAERYDLLNDALSLGSDRLWRRAVARAVGAGPGEAVLDLAAGTGTSARAFTRSGAQAIACDFSLGMLAVGARRPAPRLRFVAGDALALPLRSGFFDAVTISFGLRNVTDPARALAEMLRVTRPGGRLVVCEFSHLPARRLEAAYQRYLGLALPAVARRLAGNAAAYDYLAESIRDWPAQPELARLIGSAGWSSVRWRNLSLGIVAVHTAVRPGAQGGAKPGSGTV